MLINAIFYTKTVNNKPILIQHKAVLYYFYEDQEEYVWEFSNFI